MCIHTYNSIYIARTHSNGNQQWVPVMGLEVIVNVSLREMKTETKNRSAWLKVNTKQPRIYFSASMYTNYRQNSEQKAIHLFGSPPLL